LCKTLINILNPALYTKVISFLDYNKYMSVTEFWVSNAGEVDAVSGETILGDLALESQVDFSTFDMFIGVIPGSIAETSTLLILVGALLLLITKVGSWRIMLSGLIGGAVMALLFNALPESISNSLTSFPWYDQLLAGGFFFGIVFMATDPVSAAQTQKGKWIYGFLI